MAVQAAIATENAGGAAEEPMQFRIGVHVGDVIVEGSNLLGDSVNIAARLEALAEPGSIYVSAPARDHIGNKLPLAFDDLGDQQVKNIPQAIRVYRVQAETLAAKPIAAPPLPDKPSIAVLPFANMSGDPEQEYFVDGMVEETTPQNPDPSNSAAFTRASRHCTHLVARIDRLAARGGRYRRAAPVLTSDIHRAIQSEPRSPSSHPEAAAQSDELGGL